MRLFTKGYILNLLHSLAVFHSDSLGGKADGRIQAATGTNVPSCEVPGHLHLSEEFPAH